MYNSPEIKQKPRERKSEGGRKEKRGDREKKRRKGGSEE